MLAGRRARDHAYAPIFEAWVRKADNTVESGAGAIQERVGRAIVVVSVEYELIALGVADHHIAALGKQGLADEAGRLREPSVLDRTLSSAATISAILFSKPSFLSFENGMLAGRRRRAAPCD